MAMMSTAVEVAMMSTAVEVAAPCWRQRSATSPEHAGDSDGGC
jgi:hypothetical protein